MKVLLVGAAGYVGTLLRPALEQVHQCQYFDRKPVPGVEDRTTVGDVNDDAAISAATEGVDAVVYLAMGVKPGTVKDCEDTDAAFDVNTKAWYRFLFTGLKMVSAILYTPVR